MERLMVVKTLLLRPMTIIKLRSRLPLKVNYGCGYKRQKGYINIDVRWTPCVDVIADINWCEKNLYGICREVYLSHVLEHYAFPGKQWRMKEGTVLDTLIKIYNMLEDGGHVKIAVPDFEILAKLYIENRQPLFPRLLGRICGEQDYPENVHRCVFDRNFLEKCLAEAGFVDLQTWDPRVESLDVDASFDEIDGVLASLNLKGFKRYGRV